MKRRWLWLLVIVWLICFTVLHLQLNSRYFTMFERDQAYGSLDREPPSGRHLLKGLGGAAASLEYRFDPRTGRMEPSIPSDARLDIMEILPHDIVRHTGPWYWRFFQWGLLKGAARTAWTGIFDDSLVARACDPTNPTPFVVSVVLAAVALAGGRKKGSLRETTGIEAQVQTQTAGETKDKAALEADQREYAPPGYFDDRS